MKKKLSSLQLRIISAVVLLPFVLGALYIGGLSFTVLTMIVAGIAVLEWAKLVCGGRSNVALSSLSLLSVLLAVVFAVYFDISNTVGLLLALAAFTGVSALMLHRRDCAFLLAFGVAYVGMAFAAIAWMRQIPHGFEAVLFLAVVVWSGDVFAYFSGRTIGGPKLAPKVSPNKTWAGLWGGAVGSGFVAAGALFCFPYVVAPSVLSVALVGVLGLIMTFIGQGGDLFISALKRHYGVKDTGTLIPGHGGVLDRIDALLLVSLFFVPVAWFFAGV